MMRVNESGLDAALRRHVLAIGVAAVVLVFGLGGWAATTEFQGAVIAAGQLVVGSNVKKVQHPTGGVVGEVLARDGAIVKGGDVVVRLDDTQTRANLAIVTKSLDEMAARRAREEAERDGYDTITFPPDLLARMRNDDVASAVNGEQKQFETRRVAREGQRKQLKERIAQLNEEAGGYAAQISSKIKQIEWITKELVGVNELWEKNLVPYTRVTALEREKERLDGERGQLIATIAQSRGKIAEIELQILQIDQDMRTEVGKDLADIRAKTAELVERKVAAEDQLLHGSHFRVAERGGPPRWPQAHAGDAGRGLHSDQSAHRYFLSDPPLPRSALARIPRKIASIAAVRICRGDFWRAPLT